LLSCPSELAFGGKFWAGAEEIAEIARDATGSETQGQRIAQ